MMIVAVASSVFCLTFLIHAIHHFYLIKDKMVFVYDGRGYLMSCSFITGILTELLNGNAGKAFSLIRDPGIQEHLLRDGPVHTTVPAVIFAVLNKTPSMTDWQVFVLLNCACHSASALLVFLLAREIMRSTRWAIIAGLSFGLYPAVVINSGRYLTEPWMVLTLVSFVYLITRKSIISRFFAGGFAGLGIMLKAALAPSILLACGLSGFLGAKNAPYRQRALMLPTVFAGVALTITPWFFFTRLATGTGVIMTPRHGAYNAAVGVDLESDAWCTEPITQFVTRNSGNSQPLAILINNAAANGTELVVLAVRKFGRMIAHHWNDARLPAYVYVSAEKQELIHKVVLYFSYLGILVFLFRRKDDGEPGDGEPGICHRDAVLSYCLVLIAGHLLYLAFQSIGRYFFTALPFMMLFAMVGLQTTFVWLREFARALKLKQELPASILRRGIPISTLALSGAVLTGSAEAFALPSGDIESGLNIKPDQKFQISFDLSRLKPGAAPDAVILLIDSDRLAELASVTLNGTSVNEGIIPASGLCLEWYQSARVMRENANLIGVPHSALRQWRAVFLPLNSVNLKGPNTATFVNHSSHSICLYGACRNREYLPAPGLAGSDYMQNTTTGMDVRIPQRLRRNELNAKFSLISEQGQCTAVGAHPGFAVVIATNPGKPNGLSSPPDVPGEGRQQKLTLPVSLSTFPPGSLSPSESAALITPQLASTRTIYGWAKLPSSQMPNPIKITLRGKAKLLKGDGRLGVKLVCETGNGQAVVPALNPDFLKIALNEWTTFEMHDYLPPSNFGSSIKSVLVELLPCPISQSVYANSWDGSSFLVRDLELSIQPLKINDVTGYHLRYY